MTKALKDMIAEVNEGDDEAPELVVLETALAAADPQLPTDPLERGMDALRAQELEPLRIWSVKGPKGVGGFVCAVFLQATSEIIVMHQLPSGKFTVFTKAEVSDLSPEDA